MGKEEKKKKYKGRGDPLVILSKESSNIYRTLFSQILARRIISLQDFHYEKEEEKEVEDAIDVLKNAGLINSSGTYYYPTSFGLRKARQLNISETPRAWF
ncbi:MAG: hypothetical protein KAS87_06465 [Candidatus Omnitrophica bacterium]|nr:hypothetical protein [Candidatus Omnitrophota bacterium]